METSNNTEIIPFSAVHPTEIIKDEIKARGISQKELAIRMGMKSFNLNKLLKGENITPAIAAKLELALDIPSDFWLNLQSQYEIDSKNVALRNEFETDASIDRII
ncbi:MAG: HigA family addiction module antidote protein [Paludibacteraceae bacterium]|nr:HigA family addiction module antidote protein [Paludibacteraceae bacterium]